MLGTAIIVFREVLEAALVICVVLAAVKGIPKRGFWVSAGVVAGIAGACIIAALTGQIAAAASGRGQEIFQAVVLFTAVAMLGWHNVWMSRHGKELAMRINQVGQDVAAGRKSLSVLFVVTALAVLREGSEVVLFLYGIAASGATPAPMLAGGGIGVLLGAALGVVMYLGLLRIPTRHLFRVTGWLILLLAAGMASRGAAYLAQAGFLPAIENSIWDTSGILPGHSIVGSMLHVLIGYDPRPSVMQLIFYVATLVVIGGLMKWIGGSGSNKPRRKVAAQAA
ncbi:MAG TPA: FTR1 family protein [Gammaproteobacteria bacterium]|nr:FTR1 family protein [Gammaproteobacteria bacterium]